MSRHLGDRDPAGELGTVEPAWNEYKQEPWSETFKGNPVVLPPDPHAYIRNTRRGLWFIIAVLFVAVVVLAVLMVRGIGA